MFKTILILVMAALCLNFSAKAQDNKAIDVTTKGIQIGQQVPDITIHNLHNYKDRNGKPATSAKLSDFKGKLLILDFWATWCSPCVAMIPKMDSLQKQFGDKIQFLSITYQNEKDVLPFLEKYEKQKGKHYNLPVITADKELHKLFPHIYLPHYVWIGRDGTVRAITSAKEITTFHIEMVLKTNDYTLNQKRDKKIDYEEDKPLIIGGNGGTGENILYHSLLSSYTEGLGGGYVVNTDLKEFSKITVTNRGIPGLYRVAFSKKEYLGTNRVILKVKDTTRLNFIGSGTPYSDWLKAGNGYCYEIMLPKNMEPKLYDLMLKDLDNYFQDYKVTFEKTKKRCLILKRIGNTDLLVTKGSEPKVQYSKVSCMVINKPIAEFAEQMSAIYFQHNYPLIDETGIEKNIDLTFDADMTSVKEVNEGLQKYGLKFIEADRQINMIVIRDRSPSKPASK